MYTHTFGNSVHKLELHVACFRGVHRIASECLYAWSLGAMSVYMRSAFSLIGSHKLCVHMDFLTFMYSLAADTWRYSDSRMGFYEFSHQHIESFVVYILNRTEFAQFVCDISCPLADLPSKPLQAIKCKKI